LTLNLFVRDFLFFILFGSFFSVSLFFGFGVFDENL